MRNHRVGNQVESMATRAATFMLVGGAMLGAIAQSASAQPYNYVTNGSFEDPVVPAYHVFAAPNDLAPGWLSDYGCEWGNYEFQHAYYTPYEGNQYLELDGYCSSNAYQNVLAPGGLCRLSFYYSPRPGISAASNTVAVYWDNVLVDTISAEGGGNGDTVWTYHQYLVDNVNSACDLTAYPHRLEFRDVGTSDSYGGFIDDVSVIWASWGGEGANPYLVDASSRKTHAGAGEFDIPLRWIGNRFFGVECRQGGPTLIVLRFSEPVYPLYGSWAASDFGIPSAYVVLPIVNRPDLSEVWIYLTGVPDEYCLELHMGAPWNIVDANANPLACTDTYVTAVSLEGDVSADGQVSYYADYASTGSSWSPRLDVNLDGTVNSSDKNQIWSRVGNAAPCMSALKSATSYKNHGQEEDWGIDLYVENGGGAYVTSECRQGGPTKLVLMFTGDIQADDNVPSANEVTLSAGILDDVAIDGDQMTITLHDVPDESCLMVQVQGLSSTSGYKVVGDTDVLIRCLQGDINNSGQVNEDDIDIARMAYYGEPLDPQIEPCRCDLDLDGSVTLDDIWLINYPYNLHTAPACNQ